MNAQEIEIALAEKFSGQGWAFFKQFRPMTSWEATMNSIDAIAVGLWHQNNKIIAFEIKVQRGDFLKDVDKFRHKHRFALEITHEFYYICPHGLIDKTEVPEIAGLMYVDKSFGIKKKKPAVLRELEDIPFHLFQAFAQEFGNKIDHTKVPVKYLGKNITQDDLMEIVEKKKEWSFENNVEEKVRNIIKEKEEKKSGRDLFIRELKEICGYYSTSDDDSFPEIKKYAKAGREVSGNYGLIRTLKDTQNDLNKFLELLPEKKG